MKAIINGRIIREKEIVEDHVLVYDERIEKIMRRDDFRAERGDEIIDAAGFFVAPGFIDVHIHGCKGFDAMDDCAAALPAMQQALVRTGVTAFLPTTMTCDFPAIYRSLERIRTAMGQQGGARILGCHLEGPFINAQYKGAQAEKNIEPADFSRIERYKDIIKIVTIAPETLPDYSFVDACRQSGIVVSLGHSAADYEQSLASIAAGISHITHICNAMTPLHHRRPGTIGAAFDTAVNCEIIADNVHVHPAVQRLLYRGKQPQNIVLVTDALRACMQPDGISELGGQTVYVKDQVARLADGTLAGSVLTLNRAVKNFWDNTRAPLAEVVAMVSANPARELGIFAEMGSIAAGKQADLTIFDENLAVYRTVVKGKTVYRQE